MFSFISSSFFNSMCCVLVAQVALHWHFDCVNTDEEPKFNLVIVYLSKVILSMIMGRNVIHRAIHTHTQQAHVKY